MNELHAPQAVPPIEAFAQVCALLDDGFADRAAVLSAAGLDEEGWRTLSAEWVSRLATSDPADLPQRFRRAYAQARQHAGRLALPEQLAEDDTAQDAPAIPFDDEPAEGTIERAFPLAGPALPFRGPGFLPPAATAHAADHVRHEPALVVPAPGEPTLEVPYLPLAAGAELPFSMPPLEGRRMRLQRFDTQTGQPLPTPIWVEQPTPAR